MDPYLQITDNELVIPGVKQKRVFFHISDTHLSVRDALSTEEEARQAEEWEARWMIGKENFARSFGEPFGDAQRITTVAGLTKCWPLPGKSGRTLSFSPGTIWSACIRRGSGSSSPG